MAKQKNSATKTVLESSAEVKAPASYDMPTAEDIAPKKKETPAPAAAPESKVKRYRFMTTLNNVNIGNAIHNNVQVAVFNCVADSEDAAMLAFREHVAKNMGGRDNYATYFRAVFGDAVTIESYPDGVITKRVIPHGF